APAGSRMDAAGAARPAGGLPLRRLRGVGVRLRRPGVPRRMSGTDVIAVLHEHGGLLRRMAFGYERNAAEREELAQEMAIAVWEALPRYRGDGSLKAFVAKVAQFTALERLRGRRPLDEPDDAPGKAASPGPGPDLPADAAQR